MTVKEFKRMNHYRFIGMWAGRHARCGNCRNRSYRGMVKVTFFSVEVRRLICHACGHGFLTKKAFVCDKWVSS